MQSETALVRPRAALRSDALWLVAVLSAAFLLRLVWVALSPWEPLPGDDAFRYDFAARALAEGHGYIHLNGAPTAFWPPGYPLLLAGAYALFGQSVVVAQLLNVALGTATVGLVYLIGQRTLGPRAALIGAALVAGFPSLIFFSAVTLSEITFTFLALLAVYLLLVEAERPERRHLSLLIGAGLVLGYASLVRGQAMLLPLVFLPFWRRSGTGWSHIGDKLVALALGIGLIVAPWSIRNAVQMEAPVLIATNAGIDFWIGHHEGANGAGQRADELIFAYPELDTVEREVRVNAEGFKRGLAYALTHPLQELALPFQKLFWLYYNDEEGLEWNLGHGSQPFLDEYVREGLLSLSNVYYFAVLGFLALGAPLWFSLRHPGRLLLISLVVYWTAVHLVFFGDARFHAPIVPLIALLAALPWVALWSGRPPWTRPA